MQSFIYDSVDSTNDEARRLVERGAIEREAYVLAREQTAGKGTRGRRWCSERDAGVYLSFVRTFPRGAARPTMLFTLAAGVACAEVLEEHAGVAVALKPVNDLYASGGKLGGILGETTVAGGDVTCLVMGVGINVRDVPRSVERAGPRPVSLEALVPPQRVASLDLSNLAASLAARLSAWCRRTLRAEPRDVLAAYEPRLLAGHDMPLVPTRI